MTPAAERFSEVCLAHLSAEAERLRGELAAAEAEVRRAGEALLAACRRRESLRWQLAGIEQGVAAGRQRYASAFEGLTAEADVEAIEPLAAGDGSPGIRLRTAPLWLWHQGRRHALGRYRIDIRLDGRVAIQAEAPPAAHPAWDHPHVQAGVPCLGNLQPALTKLIGEGELAVAARLLLDFLRTYDPETAYGPIDLWSVSAP